MDLSVRLAQAALRPQLSPATAAFRGTTLLGKLEARAARGLRPAFVASDIDHTMWRGDRKDAAIALHQRLREESIPLAYVTGRGYSAVQEMIRREGLPLPDMVAPSVGTQRYLDFGRGLELDRVFNQQISARGFQKDALAKELAPRLQHPGFVFERQPHNFGPEEANKLSYYVTVPRGATPALTRYQNQLQAAVGNRGKVLIAEDIHFSSPDQRRFCLDVLPVAKAHSISDVGGLNRQMQILTAGDSGNDANLLLDLQAPGVSVVVGGSKDELVSEVLRRSQATSDRHLRKVGDRNVYMGTHTGAEELGPESILKGLDWMLRTGR